MNFTEIKEQLRKALECPKDTNKAMAVYKVIADSLKEAMEENFPGVGILGVKRLDNQFLLAIRELNTSELSEDVFKLVYLVSARREKKLLQTETALGWNLRDIKHKMKYIDEILCLMLE